MSHLQLNLSKTELFVIPDSPSIEHDISIQLSSDLLSPTSLQQIWLSWLIWTYYTQRMVAARQYDEYVQYISLYSTVCLWKHIDGILFFSYWIDQENKEVFFAQLTLQIANKKPDCWTICFTVT